MTQVQRFWAEEAKNIRCVREADYDAAVAREAALQQRLNEADQRIDELVGLLRSAATDYACCLESGFDRITSLGGECDSVAKMLDDNPNYSRYRAALQPETKDSPEVGS